MRPSSSTINHAATPLAMLAPLVVWAIYFLFVYLTVALVCARQLEMAPLAPLLGIASAAAVAATLLLGRAFLRLADEGDPNRRLARRAGLWLSVVSLIAVLWTALPLLFIPPCR